MAGSISEHTTRVSRVVAAPRDDVYRALLDADAVARWRVPDGMWSEVHEFAAHEGGRFRVSLHHDAPDRAGKTAGHTDTYHGRFTTLVPGELVEESLEFETEDPAFAGVMRMTTTLSDHGAGGTVVEVVHRGVPDGVSATDNEAGTMMALGRLAQLLEQRS